MYDKIQELLDHCDDIDAKIEDLDEIIKDLPVGTVPYIVHHRLSSARGELRAVRDMIEVRKDCAPIKD